MAQYVNRNRIKQARLAANMSRADLAFAIRRVSNGQIRATERGVAGWERGEYRPRDGVMPAIAAVTGNEISYFYESDDDQEDARLPRDLHKLPADLRLRVERALARKATA